MIGKRGLAVVLAASLFATVAALAQQSPQPKEAEAGFVSGSGTVVLKRRPDRMRVRVEVFARGKTTKEALENLKDRREAIRAQLATLGAAKDTIVFDAPQVNTSLMENRKQMEMMIRSRLGTQVKKNAKKVVTPTVVSTALTADWPLKGETIDDLLIETARLQDAVKDADLAGMKDMQKASTDDEELREELEGVEMAQNQGGAQVQPGTPVFVFLGTVTASDRARALADAFAKAKGQAEATAKAAGVTLGPLRQLESHILTGTETESAENPAQAYYPMMQGGRAAQPAEPDDPGEARGSQPGAVSYRVSVVAGFRLK